MQNYPHLYQATASAKTENAVQICGEGLTPIDSMPPEQFGGPGGMWSPETLLVAAVADCLILSFRAIARASHLNWQKLECDADGILDRVDGVTRFTRFDIRAKLTVPQGTDEHKAARLLAKAEAVCLVSNSLNAEKHLAVQVVVA